ncbi:hypothetical protein [Borrelia hermsii]|uniref:hypothetical protein n=2 Tax=Borrelia hermsii TaxID=140 RepID=UPI0012DA5798|nr:hypothetical protein [Borrelia hermsii]UPA08410.1 hypothetical protein bhDAH_001068 [Borrelia hermsii DAH]UPA08680.1 hypothetical protein bhDAH_001409 [Borrelia hermsii DAH]
MILSNFMMLESAVSRALIFEGYVILPPFDLSLKIFAINASFRKNSAIFVKLAPPTSIL